MSWEREKYQKLFKVSRNIAGRKRKADGEGGSVCWEKLVRSRQQKRKREEAEK